MIELVASNREERIRFEIIPLYAVVIQLKFQFADHTIFMLDLEISDQVGWRLGLSPGVSLSNITDKRHH